MTREDKLYSMTGATLIIEADKLGVKVACNKARTQLKESKQKVIDRILAFEASQVEEVVDNESELTDEEYAKIGLEIAEQAKKKDEEHKKSKKVKSKSVVFDLTKVDSDVELKYVPSDKSNIRVIYKGKTVAELFVRKSFVFVCTRKVVEGFELAVKSYRAYPNYHKATTVEQINNIIKEVI